MDFSRHTPIVMGDIASDTATHKDPSHTGIKRRENIYSPVKDEWKDKIGVYTPLGPSDEEEVSKSVGQGIVDAAMLSPMSIG